MLGGGVVRRKDFERKRIRSRPNRNLHTIRSGSMRKVTIVTRPIRVIIVMRILQDCYVG